MATVKIEGNTLTLDDAICKTNESLKAALLPYFPAVANAEIKRKTEGETTTITVTKKAGTKGLDPVVDALDNAPETISPILLIEAADTNPSAKAFDEAVLQMFDETAEIVRITRTLDEIASIASKTLPTGF